MKRKNKRYFIMMSMAISLVACGEDSAQNEAVSSTSGSKNSIMVEKIFKHYNIESRSYEVIKYKACMEQVNSEDAKLIMGWSNKLEEEKKGGWRSFKSAKLVDECPKSRTAHCAGGPDTGESDFYYTDSKKSLTILREECTATYEDMTAEDKEIAARVGGKWTSFTGDKTESPAKTISPEHNENKAETETFSDSEQAAKNVQDAEAALGEAFYGHRMKDKASILELLKEEPGAIRVLEPKFRKDKDIVLAATSQNGKAFQYADESLKKDREFVIAVVTQNADALKFADDSMKKDKEVILAALKSDRGNATNDVDESLKKNKEIVLALLKDDYNLENFIAAPKAYKKNKAFMMASIKIDPNTLRYVDPSLLKERDFVLFAVNQRGTLLCALDEPLKNDKEIVLAAASNTSFAMSCVKQDFLEDKEFMLSLIKQSKEPVELSPKLENDKEIQAALKAFKERMSR